MIHCNTKKLLLFALLVGCFSVINLQKAYGQLIDTREGAEDKANSEDKPLLILSASLGADGIYDNNIFKTKYNAQDDYYFAIQPSVGLNAAYKALTVDIVYRPRFYFFTQNFDHEGLDTFMQDLNFATTVLATEYLQIDFRDTLGAVKTRFGGLETPDNLLLRNQFNPRLVFSYPLSERLNTEVIAEFIRTDIQDPGEDYYQYGGSGNLSYELTPSFSLVGGAGANKSIYDNPFIGDIFQINGQAGFTYNFFERLRGEILGLYDYIWVAGPLDDGNFGFRGKIEYDLTETTRIYAQAENRYAMDVTAHTTRYWQFSGGIKQEIGPRTMLQIDGYHDIFEIPVFSPVEDRLWGAGAEINYEITEHLSAKARYEYSTNIGPTTVNDFQDHRGILGLVYDFGAIFTIN